MGMHDTYDDIVAIKSKLKLKPPSKYKVLLLNDDYTTMDFVVDVLQMFFHFSEEAATQIMLEVHKKGQAVCGVYIRDIAETKAQQVNCHAREQGHPLLCKLEKVD